jgi:glycosyltransferase involved in cell wall biosynthesis
MDKGTIHLVKAMQKIWHSGRMEPLVLIGHPLPEFQEFYRQLPPDDRRRILFLGMVEDDVKKDALAAASVFALPSRADSFGIVYLEAWLYGLPVVAARTWGVSDVIDDGSDGVLVPFGDPGSLAEAITDLLDHPETAAAMGERGRNKVLREHTWGIKCQLVLDLYERLVGQRD